MQIQKLPIIQLHTNNVKELKQQKTQNNPQIQTNNNPYKSLPLDYKYNAQINFGNASEVNRTVPHIDYEEYMAMKDHRKTFFRKKYKKFINDASIDKSELFDKKSQYLPLASEETMEEFIKTSKLYTQYREQPIICLGRSPKWFLNAALWMKDGIEDYKFVAFSKYWYRPDKAEGIRRLDKAAPTEVEEAAYKRYLKRIKADPETIVNHFEKTGKKTVITDYICSGKGMSSFLDIISKFAEEKGILERFSKAIEIVGIGSMDYMENFYHEDECISEPYVYMPERLIPYERNIKQKFYNMDYNMFSEMLLNQNTNECRSTYYPHEAWTVYNPDRFKTGLITDMKKVKEVVKALKGKDTMSSFTPAMYDYRNLVNFRILDALFTRKLLKAVHHSKV